MGGNIYMLLAREDREGIARWRSIEYCSKAKDAFDLIKSGDIPHEYGELFTIISVDYTSDITDKARFLWVSDGSKIIPAPPTHIFMGNKTWLQFWDGLEASADSMFAACSVVDRKKISETVCECIRMSFRVMSKKNLNWANESVERIAADPYVDDLISQGNEIMMDVAFPEYESVYSVIKALHTVKSISPHYEAHVAVTNAASSLGGGENVLSEMASIVRSHIPLHRLILDTVNSIR